MKRFKNSGLKRGLCVVLVLSTVLLTCACGKKNAVNGGSNGGSKGNGGSAMSAEPSVSKQNVFRAGEVFEIPDSGDGFNINQTIKKADGIYAIGRKYTYEENSNLSEVLLLYFDNDGKYKDSALLYSYESTYSDDPEGGDMEVYNDTEESLKLAATSEAADMPMIPADNPEDGGYSYDNTDMGMMMMGDDIIFGIENHNYGENAEDGDSNDMNENTLIAWDYSGNELFRTAVDMTPNSWVNNFFEYQGNAYVYYYDDNGDISRNIYDSKGNEVKKGEKSKNLSVFGNLEYVVKDALGNLYVIFYDENHNYEECVAKLDPEKEEIEEASLIPQEIRYSSTWNPAGEEGTFLISGGSGNGLYKYTAGSENAEMFVDYINSDIQPDEGFYRVIWLSDEHILGIYTDIADYRTHIGDYTYVRPEDIQDKKVLLIAGEYIDSDLKKRIIEYNKKSTDYRFIIKTYEGQYNDSEGTWESGLSDLNNDIITGGMPDILVVSQGFPLENYVSKGLVADVDKLIAEDPELSQNKYLENVFEAFRLDGKLYQVVPYFYAVTYIGKSKIVGNADHWSFDEFFKVADSLERPENMFGGMARGEFLEMGMRFSGTDFIDLSTGKCRFDSDDFVRLLEFAKELPEELGEDYYSDDYWNNYESQYIDERSILLYLYFSDMQNVLTNMKGYFGGEDVSFVGFPGSNEVTGMISADNTFALSAKSENLNAAWDFVKWYLSDDYQKFSVADIMNYINDTGRVSGDYAYFNGIPVMDTYYQKWLEKGMEKPYYWDFDEKGKPTKKVEMDPTFYMNNEEIKLDVFTREELDRIDKYLRSINKKSYFNDTVMNIINEEAAAYFAGQKDAKAVADVIQNRVKVYVNENR